MSYNDLPVVGHASTLSPPLHLKQLSCDGFNFAELEVELPAFLSPPGDYTRSRRRFSFVRLKNHDFPSEEIRLRYAAHRIYIHATLLSFRSVSKYPKTRGAV